MRLFAQQPLPRRAATPAFSNPRMSLKGRGQGLRKGLSLFMSGTPKPASAGERRKPTVPPCGMGKVRSRRNKPAKRAKGISRRFLSPASQALEFLHLALLWGAGIPLCGMPRIIAGGEGRGFRGPNPRIKAKEKCAATAAREGAASAILRGPARIRACRGAVDGNAGSGGCGPQERRPSPPDKSKGEMRPGKPGREKELPARFSAALPGRGQWYCWFRGLRAAGLAARTPG